MKDEAHIGEWFQEATKYSPGGGAFGARAEVQPGPFKTYAQADRVPLGLDELPEGSLWEALARRRSRRTFSDQPLARQDLAKVLWAAQGVTARAGRALLLRTAPSAGALYPVETYVAVNNVAEVSPGVYHYNVADMALETVRAEARGTELRRAALGQAMAARAAAVLIWTAVIDRCSWKYAQRAYRYIYLDAGHVCENVYLAAEDLGLGCCGIAAFFDDEVNALLGVDGQQETAIYLAAVGPIKKTGREG